VAETVAKAQIKKQMS
jgi:hypothetical protein